MVPEFAGVHEIEVVTWRPVLSAIDEMRRNFLGGGPSLEDPTSTNVPTEHDGSTVLNKFGLQTKTVGTIKLKLNVINQTGPDALRLGDQTPDHARNDFVEPSSPLPWPQPRRPDIVS